MLTEHELDELSKLGDDIMLIVGDNEHLAWLLLIRLRERFGWTGTEFGRTDADQAWQLANKGGSLPNSAWDRIKSSVEWEHTIAERLNVQGWDQIKATVLLASAKLADERPQSQPR